MSLARLIVQTQGLDHPLTSSILGNTSMIQYEVRFQAAQDTADAIISGSIPGRVRELRYGIRALGFDDKKMVESRKPFVPAVEILENF